MSIIKKLEKARRAGVPLIHIETSDPAASIVTARTALNGTAKGAPVLAYDCVRGFCPMNEEGSAFLKSIGADEQPGFAALLVQMSVASNLSPAGGVLFWHQPDWNEPLIRQGIWLLRDSFKSKGWTWIGLSPSADLPPMLRLDVLVIPEKLPDAEELGKIVDTIVSSVNKSAKKAGAKPIDMPDERRAESARALRALNAFSAENTVAMNISATGLDIRGCWKDKLRTVRQSQGVELIVDNPTFGDLAGLANIKEFMTGIIKGKYPVDVILFLDEVEKATSGNGTDLSGVTTKMIGQFLTGTQDRRWKGIILTGVPGSGKTYTGQCCAGEANCVFAKVSFAEMQSSLVGSSEANMKAMFSTIDALGSNVFMIATCNNMSTLTPELVGRFKMGTFFYDYPDAEERASLWKMYMKKYGLKDQEAPPSDRWVGREIDAACEKADIMNRPLSDVAKFVIPQAISQRAKLDEIRRAASGRYLSATHPGYFNDARLSGGKPGDGPSIGEEREMRIGG
jgi:hypothetical protein